MKSTAIYRYNINTIEKDREK